MIQHNSVNINLSDSKVDKLEPATKKFSRSKSKIFIKRDWPCK